MEEECHNLDLARNLLLDASEKDPCDLYVWQVGWVVRHVSSVGQVAHLRHSSKRRHGFALFIFGIAIREGSLVKLPTVLRDILCADDMTGPVDCCNFRFLQGPLRSLYLAGAERCVPLPCPCMCDSRLGAGGRMQGMA